jgi:hypothetical protein
MWRGRARRQLLAHLLEARHQPEVLVSGIVKDLLAASSIDFQDRATPALRDPRTVAPLGGSPQ